MQISAVDKSLITLAAIYCQYGRVIVFFATITVIDSWRVSDSPKSTLTAANTSLKERV